MTRSCCVAVDQKRRWVVTTWPWAPAVARAWWTLGCGVWCVAHVARGGFRYEEILHNSSREDQERDRCKWRKHLKTRKVKNCLKTPMQCHETGSLSTAKPNSSPQPQTCCWGAWCLFRLCFAMVHSCWLAPGWTSYSHGWDTNTKRHLMRCCRWCLLIQGLKFVTKS